MCKCIILNQWSIDFAVFALSLSSFIIDKDSMRNILCNFNRNKCISIFENYLKQTTVYLKLWDWDIEDGIYLFFFFFFCFFFLLIIASYNLKTISYRGSQITFLHLFRVENNKFLVEQALITINSNFFLIMKHNILRE